MTRFNFSIDIARHDIIAKHSDICLQSFRRNRECQHLFTRIWKGSYSPSWKKPPGKNIVSLQHSIDQLNIFLLEYLGNELNLNDLGEFIRGKVPYYLTLTWLLVHWTFRSSWETVWTPQRGLVYQDLLQSPWSSPSPGSGLCDHFSSDWQLAVSPSSDTPRSRPGYIHRSGSTGTQFNDVMWSYDGMILCDVVMTYRIRLPDWTSYLPDNCVWYLWVFETEQHRCSNAWKMCNNCIGRVSLIRQTVIQHHRTIK